MSATPDRFRRFHGATDSGDASCEYPPHSDLARVHVQDSTSSSTPSEDFSQYFDFDAFPDGDQVTDVTIQSDVPSEVKHIARPRVQTSARPAAPVSNHDDDCAMPDAPSLDPQPSSPQLPHVWPRLVDPQPPRDQNIQVETSPSPPPSTDMGQARATSSPSQRTRTVKNPEETSQVREVGACYRCRMNKVMCKPSSVCPACEKRPLSDMVCIRRSLRDMVTAVLARWNWNDPIFFMPGREQFAADRHVLHISCSDSTDSPRLPVVVGPFILPNQKEQGKSSAPRFGIAPDDKPREKALYQWMEEQILTERTTDFETQMDKLLVKFVRRSQTTMPLDGQCPQVFETLLSNLLKMRCMWKVWSCKQFFVWSGSRLFPLDLPLASVQDSLRLYAAQAISELERKIISEIELHLVNKKEKDATRPAPEMRTPCNISKWLLLWQVILIYRQSLSFVMEQQQTNAAPLPITVMPMDERHNFRETTRQLLDAVIVIYSGVFQKGTVVKSLRDAGPETFGGDLELYRMYKMVWQAMPEFYQQVSGQVSPTDKLFIEYIVGKERDIVVKGRPARKWA